MFFDKVLKEPDQKRIVLRVLKTFKKSFLLVITILGRFLWIRIRTQGKKANPDKRIRIRNTGM